MINGSESVERVKTVEYAPIGIWKLDWALTIVEANQAVCQLLGGTAREEIVGKNVLDILPFLPRALFRSVQSSGQPLTHKQVSGLHDPNKLMPTYWEVTIGPVLTGKQVTGFVLSTVEVSQLEHLLQQREDFILALSHHLKTPLVGADRTLEQLLHGVVGELSEQQSELISTLKRSNLHLLGMVQDLIEVYRYETNSAHLKLEAVDLAELARQCVDELQKTSRARLVALRCDLPTMLRLRGDRQALKRLLLNLIEHCLNQTASAGVVEISAHSTADSAILKITDQAPWSEDDDPERVFTRFSQGEPGKNYSPSSGLGLYLCRQIATAHGGTIAVERGPEQGTIYSVKLCSRRQ